MNLAVPLYRTTFLTLTRASCKAVKFYSNLSYAQQPDWGQTILEAEKIVDYKTSQLKLGKIFCDELVDASSQLKNLYGSDHPILNIGRELLKQAEANDLPAWGLLVLLISNAANGGQSGKDSYLQKQRSIAEMVEMIRASYIIHSGVVDVRSGETCPSTDESIEAIKFGNKVSVITGDYILARVGAVLASLRNQDVTGLMSSVVRDVMCSGFVGRYSDEINAPLPTDNREPECRRWSAVEEWTERSLLAVGNLLGKSCLSSALLAGHTPSVRFGVFGFSKNLALSLQAYMDRELFKTYTSEESFSLVSAPVLFQVEEDPGAVFDEIHDALKTGRKIDFSTIHNIVMNGPGLDLTEQLQKNHAAKALSFIDVLQDCDAKTALIKITEISGGSHHVST